MKRLIKRKKNKRLIKIAEWTSVDPLSEDIVQIITNCMADGVQIQIDYEGSGWRLIQPYGWNSSKVKANGEGGNILLMCYKDTGEIRSYRLDRIKEVLIDDSLMQNQPIVNDIYEFEDYNNDPSNFEIPELPNMDQIIEETESESGNESPFEQGINYLNDSINTFEENLIDNVSQSDDNVDTFEYLNNSIDQLNSDTDQIKNLNNNEML